MADTSLPGPSSASSAVFDITELLEMILRELSVSDLARARRVSKRFEAVITNSTLQDLKEVLFLSATVPAEFSVWDVLDFVFTLRQAHISKAVDGGQELPIVKVNATIERFEIRLPARLSPRRVFRSPFDETAIYFDALALLHTLPDGGMWDRSLLTQHGAPKATLHITSAIGDRFGSVVQISAATKGDPATIGDLKQAIRIAQRRRYIGKQTTERSVSLIIPDCVTERAVCVQTARYRVLDARAREAREAAQRVAISRRVERTRTEIRWTNNLLLGKGQGQA